MRILGIQFFEGTARSAVDAALERGGLIVAPSATCFTRLQQDEGYRTAMVQADLVLPDSGLMVLLWRRLRGQQLNRISGLAYLQELLARPDLKSAGAALWILPNDEADDKTMSWLRENGFVVRAEDFYVAPMYGPRVEDAALAQIVDARRPRHVVIALSGGVQEKLGHYLREKCSVRTSDFRPPTSDPRNPAIHCIGAAMGFIAGYQVAIPKWADRFYMGWFLRLLSNPRRFGPRAMNAFALPAMIKKYGSELPPLERGTEKL